MRAALFLAAALAAGAAAHGAEPPKDAPTTIPANTYGQHLIAGALAANPQVLVMALHVTPPGSKTNVIVASNIGRLGKPADEDDLRVITSGQPNLE
ncbi:MAG: TonB-dependent siderophore receptor, partial [Phenylobacterium sp.]|nr:TonB-dependent siderophore receptor [Phenylobacterium sp.]